MGGVFQFFLSSLFGFFFLYLVSFYLFGFFLLLYLVSFFFFIWFLSRLRVVARISYYIDSQRNQTENYMCLG